ncbi:hypothetical protein EV356DRAFT_13043 [Viridothelium virens]|uniref:Uncharacterized protein n=1 Tax=Viridothelium virens TaxID=1048519 RepID=A0A6A6HGU5_VIRVR|nr:hypothetical protein EV356DRAFT_13043 [Viridothelium virens]
MRLSHVTIILSLLGVGYSTTIQEPWSDGHHLFRRSPPQQGNARANASIRPPHFDPGLVFFCPNDAASQAFEQGSIAPCLFDISKNSKDANGGGRTNSDLASSNCALKFAEANTNGTNNTHTSRLSKRTGGSGALKSHFDFLGTCGRLLGVGRRGQPRGGAPRKIRPRMNSARRKGQVSKRSPGGSAPRRMPAARPRPPARPPMRRPPPPGHGRSPPLRQGQQMPSPHSQVRSRFDTSRPIHSQSGVSMYRPRQGGGPLRAEVDMRHPGHAQAMGRQARAYPQTVAREQFPGKGFGRTGGQGYYNPQSGQIHYGNGKPAPVTRYRPEQVPPEVRRQAQKAGNRDGVYSTPMPQGGDPRKGAADYAKQGGQWALKGGQWVLHNAWNLQILQGMGQDIYYAVKPNSMDQESAEQYDQGYNDVPENDPYYDDQGYAQDQADYHQEVPYDAYYDRQPQGAGSRAPPPQGESPPDDDDYDDDYYDDYYPPEDDYADNNYPYYDDYPPDDDYPEEAYYPEEDDDASDDDDTPNVKYVPSNLHPDGRLRHPDDNQRNGVPNGW